MQNTSENLSTICNMPPTTADKKPDGFSLIINGLLGIIVNTGNLAPAITEKVPEMRLPHIYSGYLPGVAFQTNVPGSLSVSQTHLSFPPLSFPPASVSSMPYLNYWE